MRHAREVETPAQEAHRRQVLRLRLAQETLTEEIGGEMVCPQRRGRKG